MQTDCVVKKHRPLITFFIPAFRFIGEKPGVHFTIFGDDLGEVMFLQDQGALKKVYKLAHVPFVFKILQVGNLFLREVPAARLRMAVA